MDLSKALASELQHEAATTRRCLERVPESAFDWKPHEKSMTMRRLATHIAEMTEWMTYNLTTDELDFAARNYQPTAINSTAELLQLFDKNVAQALDTLKNVTDNEHFMQPWTLRNGDKVLMQMPRVAMIRGMVMNHIVHHRGQLSVYLRLNDIPVPSIYGPSADEGTM